MKRKEQIKKKLNSRLTSTTFSVKFGKRCKNVILDDLKIMLFFFYLPHIWNIVTYNDYSEIYLRKGTPSYAPYSV